ncbi:hypothetical protein [Thermogymnomonas acidicola]|uniref:hypothetical protein n=1 Tax=Thermogymnomonas acidicola TaxID=399579 RepID=UPI000AD76E79|nr:hypothetical protein [Thermogymnomonas acidicola]
MAPIVGKLHQPPLLCTRHSAGRASWSAHSCPGSSTSTPPRAIPISYYHSNIDTDEVLFYSSGNFMSRRGIEAESITVHVRGLIHGPQPGAVEAAIGKEAQTRLQ